MTSPTPHPSTSSPPDSPANPSPPQDNDEASTISGGSYETLSLFGDPAAHVGSSWKTCGACSQQTVVTPSGQSLTRWPTRGRLLNGHVYAHQTSAPPTSGCDGSASLMPTPTARDWKGGVYTPNVETNGLLGRTVWHLLPTPTTKNLENRQSEGFGPNLGEAIRLLPTPTAGNPNDGEDLASCEARRQRNKAKGYNGNGQGTPLAIAAQQITGPTNQPSDGGNTSPATPPPTPPPADDSTPGSSNS